MNRKLENLLADIFPGWALRRLQARQRRKKAEEKAAQETMPRQMCVNSNVRENERRRYSDFWER